jgi:hypothetical protein
MRAEHPITYIGMQKLSARRWIHVGYDEATKRIVPMPKHLVPQKPEPKHP